MILRSALLMCMSWPVVSSAAPTDDSEVLTAVASDICRAAYSSKYLVLDTAEDVDSSPGNLEGTGLNPEVAQSLKERNKQRPRLPAEVDYKCMRLTDTKPVDFLFRADSKRDGWKEFHRNFPRFEGITRLTLPGYSSSNLDAAVIVSNSCGWLCGSGQLYVLQRTGNAWIVVKRVGLWIS